MTTPEERRDAAIQAAAEVGASLLSAIRLAAPETPHVVEAYALSFAAADPGVLAALAEVRADTETNAAGLVPWTPEDATEIAG